MAWRYDVEFCAKHRESRILRRLTAREKRRGGWLRVIKRKSLHAGEILFAFGKRKETCRRNGKNFITESVESLGVSDICFSFKTLRCPTTLYLSYFQTLPD